MRRTSVAVIFSCLIFVPVFEGDLYASPSGHALYFENEDFVDLGTSSLLNPIDAFTIEVWTRPISKYLGAAVFSRYDGGVADCYALHTGHKGDGVDRYEFLLASQKVFSSEPVSFGEWTHLAATFDRGRMKLYRDGCLQASAFAETRSSTISTLIGNLMLDGSPIRGAMGVIDEVRFWSTARTEEEINEFKHVSLTGAEAGLVGLWNFDEGSGQVAHDSGPNSLDGVLGFSTEDLDGDPQWIPFDYVFPAETDTPTPSPTATETGTPTPSPTATETEVPTGTFVPTKTPTVPPTATPTLIATLSTGIPYRHWDFY